MKLSTIEALQRRMLQIGKRWRFSLYLPSACGGLENLFNLPAIAIYLSIAGMSK
ncbi:MAG: hypothetical protein ACYSSO_12465 [Planctomycetota bacterium]